MAKADDHAKRQKAEDLAKTPKADDQAKTKKRRKKAMKNAIERYVKTTTTIEETVEKSNDMRDDAIDDTVEKTDDVGDDEINETAPNPWIRLNWRSSGTGNPWFFCVVFAALFGQTMTHPKCLQAWKPWKRRAL